MARDLLLALAALTALMVHRLPAAAIEPWETVLRAQMQSELGCRVVGVGGVRMIELAGEVVIDGHADCEDGRAYDFTRPRQHMKFEFRLCQPSVC